MSEMTFRKVVAEHGQMSLVPTDKDAAEWLGKTKDGQEVMMTGKRPRNPKHHRKLWKLLSIVSENMSVSVPPDHLLEIIKIRLGYVTMYSTKTGPIPVTKSISFASMAQDEFDEFYNKAIALVCSDIIPGAVPEDLQREILEAIA